MAPGSSPAVRTGPAPRAEPPRAGLTNRGSPSLAMIRSSTALAPRSWNVSLGSVTESGVRSPAVAARAFAAGLSNAKRQASAREPTYGTLSSPRISLIAPSSPHDPWMAGNTAVGGSAMRRGIRAASASAISASTPASLSASHTRRPDRSETSRSGERPPARTTTRSRSRAGPPGQVVSDNVRPGGIHASVRRRRRGPERRPQLDLALDHRGEPSYPFPDPSRLREAVRQPRIPGTGAVGEEPGARNVGDPGRDGPGEHGLGVDPVREPQPHVEPPARDRPPAALRHERGQGAEHGVPAFPVELAENLDLLAPWLGGQVLADHELGEAGVAKHGGLGGQHEQIGRAHVGTPVTSRARMPA